MNTPECTCKARVGRSGLLAQQYEESAYIVRCELCKNAPDALAELFALVEEGVLVRNIAGDNDALAYLKSATRVVSVLAKVREILKPRCPHRCEKPHDACDACGQTERDNMIIEAVTNSEIIYYGPHPCDLCGRGSIVRGSAEHGFGHLRFDYPVIAYPNHNWTEHFCEPATLTEGRTITPQRTLASCPNCGCVDQVNLNCANHIILNGDICGYKNPTA